MPEYTCFRCDGPIAKPIEQHAHYVMGDDTVTEEPVEVARAFVPNDAVKDAISRLQANHYPDTSTDRLMQAVAADTGLTNYLGTPPADADNDPPAREANAKDTAPALADFDTVDVAAVADAPEDTVKVERVIETQTVQKTGLVHRDEVVESDLVIW